MIKKILILGLLRPFLWLLSVLIFLGSLYYLRTTIYDFPEQSAFSGNQWYNPYADIAEYPFAYKANFHAHSKAWGGLTNGNDTEEALAQAYLDKGYDVIGISNYHKITGLLKRDQALDFPVYEHGYNFKKSHRLAMGAHDVTYFDYPFFQSTSHKQHLIEIVDSCALAVTIAHPLLRHGHTPEDMSKLVGYDFVEVLNHYRISDEEWDAALSAGRYVTIQADDDTHDIYKEPTFVMFNRIYSKSRKQENLIEAMKLGRSYGVHALDSTCNSSLDSCLMVGDTLKVWFSEKQKSILFTGEGHHILQADSLTDHATFIVPEDQPYVRIESHQGWCSLYLNPIIRWDGQSLPFASNMIAEKNWALTYLSRFAVILFMLLLFYSMFKLSRRLGRTTR